MSGAPARGRAWWRGETGCGFVLAAGAAFAALSLRMALLDDVPAIFWTGTVPRVFLALFAAIVLVMALSAWLRRSGPRT